MVAERRRFDAVRLKCMAVLYLCGGMGARIRVADSAPYVRVSGGVSGVAG